MAPQPLGSPKSAPELLDLYYLDARCAILETAAALDRVARSRDAQGAASDQRLKNLRAALSVCLEDGLDNRVEKILQLLSLE